MTAERHESLGETLRSMRRERGLSTRQLATLAEISQPTLSNIENGRARPSVATLYGLAEALAISPGMLIDDADAAEPAPHAATPAGESELRMLHAGDFEAYLVRVPAGATESHGFQHSGEDMLFVVEGEGALLLGGSRLSLRPADLVWFGGDVPHRLTAAARGDLVVQVVTVR